MEEWESRETLAHFASVIVGCPTDSSVRDITVRRMIGAQSQTTRIVAPMRSFWELKLPARGRRLWRSSPDQSLLSPGGSHRRCQRADQLHRKRRDRNAGVNRRSRGNGGGTGRSAWVGTYFNKATIAHTFPE